MMSMESAMRWENSIGEFGDELVLTRRKVAKSRFASSPMQGAFLGFRQLKPLSAVFPDARLRPCLMKEGNVLAAEGATGSNDVHFPFGKRDKGCRTVGALFIQSFGC